MSQLLERTQPVDLNATTSGTAQGKSHQTEWCCDALSGIDDAFEDDDWGHRCIFCAQRFIENDRAERQSNLSLSYVRGKHLTDVHFFGTCNLSLTYKTLEEFEVHLDEYHHTSMNDWTSSMVGRFRKQKDLHRPFRGDSPTQGHPLIKEQPSTLSIILDARLRALLDEIGISWLNRTEALKSFYTYPTERRSFNWLDDMQRLQKLYYDFFCIEEEFLVSGNVFLGTWWDQENIPDAASVKRSEAGWQTD
jgi:hypothetical protein